MLSVLLHAAKPPSRNTPRQFVAKNAFMYGQVRWFTFAPQFGEGVPALWKD